VELVLREEPRDGVVLLRLHRPDKLNALSLELRRQLADRVEDASADTNVRSIVIAGSQRAFAAGADLADLVDLQPGDPAFDRLRVAWAAIGRCPKPIVAAVRGLALGGGFELALQCDLVVAGEAARFGLPETRVGIVPGAGGMQRLARLVGRQRAMLWVLTGTMIDARTAVAVGLCAEVVADELVEQRAVDLAGIAADLAPDVAETVKRAMRLSENSPVDEAILAERSWFEGLFGTPHQRDAMTRMLTRSTANRRDAT
jgi:enoyl-CoA hydratase